MKKFLKRVNRGLLLGGIVLVGFVVFVITDTMSFKKNKPVIEDAVRSYVEQLGNTAVTKGITKDEIKKNIDSLINNCWTFSEKEIGGMNQSEYKNSLELVTEDQDEGAYISKWTASISDVSISKAGPGYAIAKFDCQIVAEFVGNAYFVTPGGIYPMEIYVDYGGEIPKELSKIAYDGIYQLTLVQKGGRWKIAGTESYGWNSCSITSADGGEGGNAQ